MCLPNNVDRAEKAPNGRVVNGGSKDQPAWSCGGAALQAESKALDLHGCKQQSISCAAWVSEALWNVCWVAKTYNAREMSALVPDCNLVSQNLPERHVSQRQVTCSFTYAHSLEALFAHHRPRAKKVLCDERRVVRREGTGL